MSQIYGYVRVSSVGQNESRQMLAMHKLKIPAARIFLDRQSGRDFHRPQYLAMIRKLKPGDLLYVKSIDRLGRNYQDVQEQWRFLTRVKKVDMHVIDMPLLDTRRDKDLLGAFIADLVLQILSFVSQNERENIRARQAEGIAAARLRGVRFGRKPVELPEDFADICLQWHNGNISASQAATLAGMSRATFRNHAKNYVGTGI